MARCVPVPEQVKACRDPKDDKFLSLAVAGGAPIIVSSDDDLLSMGRFMDVVIMSPKAFVALCE